MDGDGAKGGGIFEIARPSVHLNVCKDDPQWFRLQIGDSCAEMYREYSEALQQMLDSCALYKNHCLFPSPVTLPVEFLIIILPPAIRVRVVLSFFFGSGISLPPCRAPFGSSSSSSGDDDDGKALSSGGGGASSSRGLASSSSTRT